jgi:hypothetical protein
MRQWAMPVSNFYPYNTPTTMPFGHIVHTTLTMSPFPCHIHDLRSTQVRRHHFTTSTHFRVISGVLHLRYLYLITFIHLRL